VTLHHDLLEQAGRLAVQEPKKPRQASLRRAASSAYYALFHMLLHEATQLLIPGRPATLRQRSSRAFTHGEMRSVCALFAKPNGGVKDLTEAPLELELTEIAAAFVQRQEARRQADYDLVEVFNRFQLLEYVALARQAMSKWQAVKNSPNANVFLTALLLHNRWSLLSQHSTLRRR
jgi:hypothetical protein